MSRQPAAKPTYYRSRHAYFVLFKGKQVPLATGLDDGPQGPTYLAALDSFKRLMERGTLETAGDANTVRAVCQAYLDAKDSEVRSSTARMKRTYLKVFMAKHGDLPVNELKPYHAETIIAHMRRRRTERVKRKGKDTIQTYKWSNSSVRLFLAQLKACFNWAFNNELVTRNPFRAITAPQVSFNSRRPIVSKEDHDKVLASLKTPRTQPMKKMIIALENTGARPSELCKATVSDFDADIGAIVYFGDGHRKAGEHGHKTSRKGSHRIVRLTGPALDMVHELVKDKKPNDYIFTNGKGRPYTPVALDNFFCKLRERLQLHDDFTPTAYRHTLDTNWLKQNRNIDKLGALVGTSPTTIRKHYSHLLHEHEVMREELEAFKDQQREDNGQLDHEEIMLRMRAAK